jgi:hypothetical protein
MKTLKNIKTVVKDGKVTITADLEEKEFSWPVQQVTIGFQAAGNPHWIRHAQISQEAIFFKRLGIGFAIPIEEFNDKVAMVIEPRLSFPPVHKKGKNPLVVDFNSELEVSLQWEMAETPDPEGEWTPIKGQTTGTLNPKTVKSGWWVRCIASSEAGSITTTAAKL